MARSLEADFCVVGAGYAGLTAALRLTQSGKSVIVLEARDRVGGRVWTHYLEDGSPVDLGGTWLGPPQEAIYALAKEMGVGTYPTVYEGDGVFLHDGKASRYSGEVPKINPLRLAVLGMALMEIDNMSKKVPLDKPWDADKAEEWDAQSVANWITSGLHAPDATAQRLIRYAVTLLFSCDPSEVSMLHFLYHLHSAGGLNAQMNVKGGAEQDRFQGGAQNVLSRIAEKLGEGVQLRSPVRNVKQDERGVEVKADGISVRATRLVMAIPHQLAGHLDYQPALPADKAYLLQRLPVGSVIKYIAVYDQPFWREDGFSSGSTALDSPVAKTLDISPESGTPGMMAGFVSGADVFKLQKLQSDERRRIVLEMFSRCFGRKAASPVEFFEQDWAQEEFTRGCYMAFYPPGVIRQWLPLIRQPTGRIHWAGTETSARFNGFIEGAVLSGERVATEVLEAE